MAKSFLSMPDPPSAETSGLGITDRPPDVRTASFDAAKTYPRQAGTASQF
jgi:hypothetical protein